MPTSPVHLTSTTRSSAGPEGTAAPADAVLYFRAEDLALPRRYAASMGPSRAALEAVAATLASAKSPMTLDDVGLGSGLSRHAG